MASKEALASSIDVPISHLTSAIIPTEAAEPGSMPVRPATVVIPAPLPTSILYWGFFPPQTSEPTPPERPKASVKGVSTQTQHKPSPASAVQCRSHHWTALS